MSLLSYHVYKLPRNCYTCTMVVLKYNHFGCHSNWLLLAKQWNLRYFHRWVRCCLVTVYGLWWAPNSHQQYARRPTLWFYFLWCSYPESCKQVSNASLQSINYKIYMDKCSLKLVCWPCSLVLRRLVMTTHRDEYNFMLRHNYCPPCM